MIKTKRKKKIVRRKKLKGAISSPLVTDTYRRIGNTIPTSDKIVRFEGKNDILYEHKWKRGAQESQNTIKEIQNKSMRIGPAYNKGAVQFITNVDDVITLGRKV